jgi:CDP-glycerol glycerophosphotransferase (TagB/SpsB family)
MKHPIYKFFFGMISFPIYLLSHFIPRSKDIWVFGAWYGKQYNDNTSYLFEYADHIRSDIKVVWLTKNKKIISNLRQKGYNVFHKNSLNGFWYGSRAGVTFINCGYDDVNKYCINRSFKVQLWHGVPLKKIKSDDMINENIKRSFITRLIRTSLLKLLPFLDEQYDLIISSGVKVTDRFESAFNINRNKIIETGSPRMDIITSQKSSYSKDVLYDEESIDNCILYAPTHRRSGFGDVSYFTSLNFDDYNQFLKDNKAILLIKMHFYEQAYRDFFSDNEYSNIKLLDDQNLFDINRILYHVDLLITDYSSIFYDYLVLDRPILFLPLDLLEYQQIDRELYEDYQNSTPGEKCYDWDEIQIQLKKYFFKEDPYQNKREKIFNEFYQFSDNQNCSRIINKISNYL